MPWAELWEAVKYLLLPSGIGVGWWFGDRRKDKAAADIAERTVPSEVAIKEAGADEARLVYLQKRMDADRANYLAAIADRDAIIVRLREAEAAARSEVEHRDRVILGLRQKIDDLQQNLDEVRAQVDELTDHAQERPA